MNVDLTLKLIDLILKAITFVIGLFSKNGSERFHQWILSKTLFCSSKYTFHDSCEHHFFPKWDGILKRFVGDRAEGKVDYSNRKFINVIRSKKCGFVELIITRYKIGKNELDHIPADPQICGGRIIEFSCDVKVTGGLHNLYFIFALHGTEPTWVNHFHFEATQSSWVPVRRELNVSADKNCIFKIQDRELENEDSTLQVQNLKIVHLR